MKKYRWQILIILLTGILVGILLIIRPPSAADNTVEPKSGGTYSEGLVGSFQRLNPLFDHYNQPDRDVNRLIYNGLVTFDAEGNPRPDLAEAWGITKDGLTYNFFIKQDVKWHDGSPFTIDDVLFTIQLMTDENSVIPADLKTFWQEVQVKKLSDTNLQFILPEPYAPFIDYLSFGILPQHIFSGMSFAEVQNSPYNLQPVGTGPYKFDKLIVEDNAIKGIVLNANEEYYAGKPFIDEVTFRYYATTQEMYTAYQDGQIQGLSKVTGDILQETLMDEKASVYTSRRPELAIILLNLNDTGVDFFQDVDVRQALMKSINRSVIINRYLYGQAIPADSPILPGSWAYFSSSPIVFDAQEAINHLKNAEYLYSVENSAVRAKEGKELKFTLLYPDDEIHKQVAEAVQADWKEIGVEAELEPVSYEELIDERLVKRNYQAALVDINLSRYPDPDPYPFWDQAQATGGQNYSQWDNRVASEYLEQARITNDRAERIRLYHNFQVIFRDEAPALPLYYPVYTYAIRGGMMGVQVGPLFDPSDRLAGIAGWYLLVDNVQNTAQ